MNTCTSKIVLIASTTLVVVTLLLNLWVFPAIGANKDAAIRAFDMSHLRSIGTASLSYATDHNDQLPNASNILDYAWQLIDAGRLPNDIGIWQSHLDPASYLENCSSASIPKNDPQNSTYLFKSCVAVVLEKLNTKMPVTTPIAWTRGLQSDGTWTTFSPYGSKCGMIVFLDGRVMHYHNLSDNGGQLTRFDGKGKTANIFEALPPGIRVGEYVLTPKEKIEWARANERLQISRALTPQLLLFLAIWIIFTGLSFYRIKKKKGDVLGLFIWACVLTLLLSILTAAT